MAETICIDFGSTYTKMAVLDLDSSSVILTARKPSTVSTDASIGLLENLREAEKAIGKSGVENARILASSSAAGGLRMVVVGLTDHFSLLAGTNTALGAGARVTGTFSGLLSDEDIRSIEQQDPEILLLCGGVEGGNTDRIWHNAEALAAAKLHGYLVYAGNQEIAADVRELFLRSHKECFLADNIFPDLDTLNAGPASEVIRSLFMQRITGMKGLSGVTGITGQVIMPTPAAVLQAGRVFAGKLKENGSSDGVMIFDAGGATTDVYSFAETRPGEGVRVIGSPEPYQRRTVEGDLGLRSSALSLLSKAGEGHIAEGWELDGDWMRARCGYRTEHSAYVADSPADRTLDQHLAEAAVYMSARRHAGHIENAWTKGAAEIQEGKDLRCVDTIVGTGGPIIFAADPEAVLSRALRQEKERQVLLPDHASFLFDRKYLLFAVGLASLVNKESAAEIAVRNLTHLEE